MSEINVRAFARDPEGTETDITEGVQALYDLVIGSMNWGSGFWTAEDAAPVAALARLMGFKRAAEAERYLDQQLHSAAQVSFLRQHQEAWTYPLVAHDHVFSPVGRCMWMHCEARQGMET